MDVSLSTGLLRRATRRLSVGFATYTGLCPRASLRQAQDRLSLSMTPPL